MKSPAEPASRRAANQARTRQRIVEATAALHEEVGPAATTISAVAERAGVQRLTVYRHFPDEGALFAACSAHTARLHPPPDPAAWMAIADPAGRTQAALRAMYGYYAAREQGLAHVLRDAERLPALADALEPMHGYLEVVGAGIQAGWQVDPSAQRLFSAAVRHALDFWSWRSLSAGGLTAEEGAQLMTGLVRVAAAGE